MPRTTTFVRRMLTALVTVMVVCWPAVSALASAPPQPGLRKSAPVWLGYAIMALLLLLVLGVSLMPSKRSHQD